MERPFNGGWIETLTHGNFLNGEGQAIRQDGLVQQAVDPFHHMRVHRSVAPVV
jgi:hypothetical protein